MSPRAPAADRLRRVLALLPYIAARGEVSIGELADAFGVSERVVESDLEVLPFCGLPPYTPDRLIDVAVIEGYVSVRFAEYFSRPLRLTPAEGFTLLAAGRALLEVPGGERDGPLASALEKLEAALGAEEVVDVDIGEAGPVQDLAEAAEARERLEIDYYSFGRDVMTTRAVDPRAVVSLRGHWYLAAYCHAAEDDRLFRVDRIREVRPTGEHFERRAETVPEEVFAARPDDTRVTLELPPEARWVVESYPTESVEEASDGSLRVVLAVGARPWLERILLRVGPRGRVVEPRSWADAAAGAARRILARYEPGT